MPFETSGNYIKMRDYYTAKKAKYEFFIVAFKFFLMVGGSLVSGWMAVGNMFDQTKEKIVEATRTVASAPEMASVDYSSFGKPIKTVFWVAIAGWLLYLAFKVVKKKRKEEDGPDK
jgi:SNF family Na+-dependent transporter